MRAATALTAALVLGCGGASTPPPEPSGEPTVEPTPPAPESIGTATIEADGTLVLQLRAQTGGAVGDATLRYPPDHADYAEVKAHVGEIEVGQTVPVAPWD